MLDWLGFKLLMWLPIEIGCNPNTMFGRWCLRRAGNYAYKEERTP